MSRLFTVAASLADILSQFDAVMPAPGAVRMAITHSNDFWRSGKRPVAFTG